MTAKGSMKKIRGITPYKPTSIEKNGVRYIVDEDADMRALRYALKRRDQLVQHEEENARIVTYVERMLRNDDGEVSDNCCDAQSVARMMKPEGVTVPAVRRAMASPEGLMRFRRTLTPTGRIAWRLPKA